MKSKKRHHSSSEESGESDGSVKSDSSSDSESEDSSVSEHRYKKKKKRDDSSDSESDSDDPKRSKKRKHKKKKKKHAKKKRRSDSAVDSYSRESEESSISEGEISSKKKRKHKHKHKHSKRTRASSLSDVEEVGVERRLHSVVKERRASSEEVDQPARTYYQKEYHGSGVEYDRDREVERFYRGSSKDRRSQHNQEQYQYQHNDRSAFYHQEKHNRYKYEERPHYRDSTENYGKKAYFADKRQQKFNTERKYQEEEYHKRTREENYQSRNITKGFKQNQYEDRRPKMREYDGRDNRERRGPPEPERYRDTEYADKRERYREEYTSERARDGRRERPPRIEKPPPPPPSNPGKQSKSDSPEEENFRERNRRPDTRDERRVERADERRGERADERWSERGDERRGERHERRDERDKPRERKTRFGDADENKEYSWGKKDVKQEDVKNQEDKEKPNFGLSGKLTADTNTVNGVVIKYTEPDDAKQPKRRWRFYPFKGDKALPILYIHRQSAFLIGRDKKVVDIALEHPSISKQHAALQYRATPFTRPDGTQGRRVRPYIIDLESANGTFVNNKRVEPRRYLELLERDVVKFGFSQREYVLLHENSKDDAQDDDNQEAGALGASVTTTDQIKIDKRVKQEVAEDGE